MCGDHPDIIALGRQAGFNRIEINTKGLVIANDRKNLHALKEAGLDGVCFQFDGARRKLPGNSAAWIYSLGSSGTILRYSVKYVRFIGL